MPYPCFLIDADDFEARQTPGAMWFVAAYGPEGDKHEWFLNNLASNEYRRDWADKRPPICITLPGNAWWPIDQQFHGSGGTGWVITGEAPNLTARPSVDAEGAYHGWLTDGVLSDDLAGRTYSELSTRQESHKESA